ncbi:MAG: envelope fusion protein [Providencia heimbachae]|nr:envelope fusion protein [Providencia heimbachae]
MTSRILLLLAIFVSNGTGSDIEDEHGVTSTRQSLKQGVLFINEGRILATADRWTLAIDVNFTEFHKANDAIGDWIQELGEIKGSIEHNITLVRAKSYLHMEYVMAQERCSAVAREIEDMEYTTYPTRSQRGLFDGMGSVLKFLVGTPDNRDLENIQDELRSLKTFTEKVRHSQTVYATLINATFELSQKNAHALHRLVRVMHILRLESIKLHREHANATQRAAILSDMSIMLSTNFRIVEALISKIENELTKFKVALEKAVNGRLCAFFLPPMEFYEILSDIQNGLPNSLSFPCALRKATIYEFYELAAVRIAIWEKSYRIFVEIPLKTSTRDFSIYKALPLPNYDQNAQMHVYINPENPYFAISDDRTKFLELPDLSSCRGNAIRICAPHIPIRTLPEKSCLYGLFTGNQDMVKELCTKYIAKGFRSIWYKTEGDNKWVYSVSKTMQVIIRCPNNRISNKIINGTGFISIPSKCLATTEGHELIPHSNEMTPIKSIYDRFHIPEMNQMESEIKVDENIRVDLAGLDRVKDMLQETSALDLKNAGIEQGTIKRLLDEIKVNESQEIRHERSQLMIWIIGAIIIIALLVATVLYLKKKYKIRIIENCKVEVEVIDSAREAGQQEDQNQDEKKTEAIGLPEGLYRTYAPPLDLIV